MVGIYYLRYNYREKMKNIQGEGVLKKQLFDKK